jgi:hypothetical protein
MLIDECASSEVGGAECVEPQERTAVQAETKLVVEGGGV